MNADDSQLAAAYAVCRRMHRRHDPTLYWAARRLPADVRPAVHAVYGFVRAADELVDGPSRARNPTGRRAALDDWEAELWSACHRGRSQEPVIAALVDAARRHSLPLGELKAYMASMRQDCGTLRIATRDELDRYMDGSAAAVGRIMAPLLGAPARAGDHFARLGHAFQLTNFLRDVGKDRALDRVYLPAEELERFGIAERELDAPHASAGLRALVGVEVRRARWLFDAAAPATAGVRPEVRGAIRLAVAAYGRVLGRIESIGGDVLGRRSGLSPLGFGMAAVGALREGRVRGRAQRRGASVLPRAGGGGAA